jgi:hypothetical protein
MTSPVIYGAAYLLLMGAPHTDASQLRPVTALLMPPRFSTAPPPVVHHHYRHHLAQRRVKGHTA